MYTEFIGSVTFAVHCTTVHKQPACIQHRKDVKLHEVAHDDVWKQLSFETNFRDMCLNLQLGICSELLMNFNAAQKPIQWPVATLPQLSDMFLFS